MQKAGIISANASRLPTPRWRWTSKAAQGQACRLYQAAFNRKPYGGGLGFRINAMDKGQTATNVAQSFIASTDSGAGTVAAVLAAISESAQNKVALIGVIGNGFANTPYDAYTDCCVRG